MIEVVSVTRRSPEDLGSRALKSANVDFPREGATLPGYTIEIVGWAIAAEGEVERVDIIHGDVVVRSSKITEPRRDVWTFLGLASGKPVGFRIRIGLLGLPLGPTLRVVVRVGGERVEIAELVLRREPLRVVPPPPIHPLIVTSMGRTGSVWFSRVAGEHPAIVSHRPFDLEPRVGSYWMSVLPALADAASLMQALAPLNMDGNWWMAPRHMETSLPAVDDPEVEAWLVEDQPVRAARFCLESASDFYARVADLQQKPDVVYYAEKYSPTVVPSMLLELDPGAKEVFLVRDPRDQLASVVSWTASGRAQFAQDATTAEEYVDWLARQTKHLLLHWEARAERSLLVRYEDLVLEPLPTLTRLFDYLEVDSSPGTVESVLERARHSRPRVQRKHQTSKSPEQSIGRWQKDVDPDLWERINDVFAEELEAWYGADQMANGDSESVSTVAMEQADA